MRKIVIGQDGTEQGRDALELGRVMARILGARPVVVRALTWPSHLMDAGEIERAAEAETKELFAIAADHLDGLSPEMRWRVDRSAAAALYELAEDEKALLVIVGSSHRGPLGRVLPGSVGSSLLQGAPCGVMVAPRGFAQRDEHSLRRVGVGFDGTPEAWCALETAIGLASRLRASLSILTVSDFPRYGYTAALSTLAPDELETCEHEGQRRLQELAQQRVPASLPTEKRLLLGDPARVLADAAEDLDLMVVGSRGYGPLRRVLLGSVSRHLVRSVPCPVLILPRGVGVDPLSAREGEDAGSESTAPAAALTA